MAKRGQINLEKRIEIWTLHNLGFSNQEIGRCLSISESCVHKKIKRKVEMGSFCDRKRVGSRNIMVWGCFGGGQVGSIAKIDGKMTKKVYLKILKEHVLVCGTELIGKRFVFQQDNNPKHTAKVVKQYLNEKQEEGLLKVMTWPRQSPDCNPIELLWDYLDREVRKTPPRGKNDL